jgi:hypothetical protein
LKSFKTCLFIALGSIFTVLLVIFLFFEYGLGLRYDKKGLIKNYESNQEEIEELRSYFQSILPVDTQVYIELKSNGDLESFRAFTASVPWRHWGEDLSLERTDSLLISLGWTSSHLVDIQTHLSNANAISVSGKNNIVSVGWRRSGLGKYSYLLFDSTLTDSLISDYNDGCFSIYYKDNVVLQYGGGAFGPQCF